MPRSDRCQPVLIPFSSGQNPIPARGTHTSTLRRVLIPFSSGQNPIHKCARRHEFIEVLIPFSSGQNPIAQSCRRCHPLTVLIPFSSGQNPIRADQAASVARFLVLIPFSS